MIGQTISHYKILEKLGEGGMGIVYKAQDTKLDRLVALKFLPERLRTSEQDKTRFIQEAKAASSLNHPNVCTIHDIQEHDSEMFIVMEYVDGMTLRKKLENGPMSVHDAATYATQIGEALMEAHSKSIVHRDIKSDNIMLNTKNQIKVMDFGLAKLKGTLKLTKTSSTIGTLAYMSPEQIQGGEVDSRSDIFSFGVLLFEMLTCQMPFRSAHEAAMLYSIVNEEPDSVEKYRSDIPTVLVNLIQRTLEKNPDDRYQSVGDLVIELRRVLKQSSKVVTKTITIPTEFQNKERQSTSVPRPAVEQQAPATYRGSGKKLFVIIGGVVLTLAVAVALYLTKFQEDAPATPSLSFQSMKITRLTSNGKARTAAISPDGKYVIYSLDDAGKQSLWVRQVATNSNVQILPPGDVNYTGMTFSSDGNYVYFGAVTPTAPVITLFQIPVLGGTPRKILENFRGNITLSPDGKQISFTRVYSNTGEFSLMVANADGSNARVLATHKAELWFDGEPAWSPDGKVIACGLGSWEGGIHQSVVTVDVADGKEKKFSDRRWAAVLRLRWTPDGSGLLVTAVDLGSTISQIWQIQSSTGTVTKLTNDLSSYSAISLTGDGKSICVVQENTISNIFLLPQGDATRAKQITSGKETGSYLCWAPDGRLVYTSIESGNVDLWISNTDGSGKQQLTSGKLDDIQPAVSQDGKFVLYTSMQSGIPNIWRMAIDGSRQQQLTTGGEDYRPDISPDGKWFVFDSWDSGPNTIMKQSLDGGTPIQISELNGYTARISPDGKRVAHIYATSGEQIEIKVMIIPAEGGKSLTSFLLPSFAVGGSIRWTRDGKGISYIETRQGVSNIWTQPLDGSVPKQVTAFTSDLLSAFAWSHDASTLAVTRLSINTDVLLMTAE
jgi:serine/threonine protein kinase